MRTGIYLLSALAAAGSALAHMEMAWPYALRSKFDPDATKIDYSNTNPLHADGSNFPCKGYHTDPFRSVIDYDAGGQYNLTLSGSARHAGGSCQVSLSFDGGASFQVIHSYLGGCPLTDNWDFTIPADVPGGEALLSWSWFNLVGNREMYHNCAQVTINDSGVGGGSKAAARPEMYTANVGNGCTTIEGEETVFPNPGEAVSYAGSVTPDSPVNPKCGNTQRRHARFFPQ